MKNTNQQNFSWGNTGLCGFRQTQLDNKGYSVSEIPFFRGF